MATKEIKKELPADFGKIPSSYDFSTRKFDWSEYKNDFILRTDAVWEKQQLKDYFRNYYKCFYFNKGLKKYEFFEPEDVYTILFEGWALEDLETFPGFTPTGRTNSFQPGNGPKQRTVTATATHQIYQDYYNLCALRFEKWFRCDQIFYDKRGSYDYNTDQSKYKSYPCFRHFYESQYACTDDMFDFLMELAYAKQANDTFEDDWRNTEISANPTVYDSPDKSRRKTYSY